MVYFIWVPGSQGTVISCIIFYNFYHTYLKIYSLLKLGTNALGKLSKLKSGETLDKVQKGRGEKNTDLFSSYEDKKIRDFIICYTKHGKIYHYTAD